MSTDRGGPDRSVRTAGADGGWLAWASAGCPLSADGFGDAACVSVRADHALVIVIDGLGHGALAEHAAEEALESFSSLDPTTAQVSSVMNALHERLRPTRGAAILLGIIDAADGVAEFMSIGNIEASIWQAGIKSRRIPSVGGTIGYMMSQPELFRVRIRPGDVLVAGTDGMRSAFLGVPPAAQPADRFARALLADWARTSDDALCLVVRLLETQ